MEKQAMHELVDQRLRLVDTLLSLEDNAEGEAELAELLAANTDAVLKKVDNFKFASEMLTSMVETNKKIVSDTTESSKRISIALAKLHKLYYGYIKHSLELESLNGTNYRYIPRISKTTSINAEKLEDKDKFVNIKMKKEDWDKLSKSPTAKVKSLYDKVIAVKDSNPTVTQLAVGHPALETAITEYVYWKINTSKLPTGKIR